jgi:hypothetical protein
MTIAELRQLMDESGFICAVSKEEAMKEKGPCQSSIDVPEKKGPQSYKNITPMHFNTTQSYKDEICNICVQELGEIEWSPI